MNINTNNTEEKNTKQNKKTSVTSSTSMIPEKDPFIPAQVEQYLSVIHINFFNLKKFNIVIKRMAKCK